MTNFLEELYYGNIDPQARGYRKGSYNFKVSQNINELEEMNSARKIMSKPCVLINKLNVRKKRIWLVEHPEKNAVSSTEFVPLTSTMMSLGYLNYVALTDRFTNYMLNCSSGSSNSQKRVTPDDIMDYVITVPSLLEQVRVASFLETIDSKIQAQQDLIDYQEVLYGESESLLPDR